MKKLVLASAAMGGAALIAFGASGTFAAFNDAAQVSGSAGAGTLVLDGDDLTGTVKVDASSLQPGQSTSYAYYFDNAGTMDGDLSLELTDLVDEENGCSGSEGDPGVDADCSAGVGTGEFGSTATITGGLAIVNSAAKCTIGTPATVPLTSGQVLTAVKDSAVGPYAVKAGKGACLVLTIGLPAGAGNAVQGDSASFAIDAVLEQV